MSTEAPKFGSYTIIKSPQVLVFLTSPLPAPFDQVAKELTRIGVQTQYMNFTAAQQELFNMQLLLGLAESRPVPIYYHWPDKDRIVTQPTGNMALHGVRMASNKDIVFDGLGWKLSPVLGSIPFCAPSYEFLSSFHDSKTR